MRSADPAPGKVLRLALLPLIAIAFGGCASVTLPLPDLSPIDTTAAAPTDTAAAGAASAALAAAGAPAASASAATAAGPAPATSATTSPAPAPIWAEPVDPAAQRAFDDALHALRAGRRDEAERALKALSQSHPTLGGVHANLALLHRQAGRDADAVNELETAVRLSPKQPLYLNQLGIAYRQAGQFAKAREAYERAIALDPAYAAPQLNLAILLDLYLGDRAGATEWYQRSALLMPGDAAQINKWLVELKSRKPEASVAGSSTMAATVAAKREKP
jgi:Flp pilus assembly protein TadD